MTNYKVNKSAGDVTANSGNWPFRTIRKYLKKEINLSTFMAKANAKLAKTDDILLQCVSRPS